MEVSTLVLVGIIFGVSLAVALWQAWRQSTYQVRVTMGIGDTHTEENTYTIQASSTFEAQLKAASCALTDVRRHFGEDLSGFWLRSVDARKI